MEPFDYIDQDEGYRPTDWDSHLREPFFTEALPCESCGQPVDGERRIAPWDTELMVGPCCYYHEDLPVCEVLELELQECRAVREVQQAVARHGDCPNCGHVATQEDAAIVFAMAHRAMEDRAMVIVLREAGCSLEECRAAILEMERAA